MEINTSEILKTPVGRIDYKSKIGIRITELCKEAQELSKPRKESNYKRNLRYQTISKIKGQIEGLKEAREILDGMNEF